MAGPATAIGLHSLWSLIALPASTMVAAAVCAAPVAVAAKASIRGKSLRVAAAKPVRAARSQLVCRAAVSAALSGA